MDIVLKLRELRRMRHLTQKEAGISAGVGDKTISSFETGDRINSMKLGQFLALLGAYDTTPEEFFGSKIERSVFAELERLSGEEAQLVSALRDLPDTTRARLHAHFMSSIAAIEATSEPRLRAVR
jgi:transcriptional regulator with XRE-family HTH domain